MNLKQSLLIAVILSIIGLVAWEMYWRSKDYYPTLNDENALWAMHRADVETATKDDYIILGSSRAFFDVQLEEFKNETGKAPIQLALTGSSPLPTFHDIVNNTNFNGTVIIGVTPGLFFSTTFPGASPWNRPQSKVDYYQNRTYAQRINYQLSIPLQKNLAFISADEEEWADDIDLKSLLRRIQIGNRPETPISPPFYYFGDVDLNRNMAMTNKASTDTAFANTVIKVWHFFGKQSPPPEKDATMAFFMEDLEKFKAREGNVILVRFPSSGGVRIGEKNGLPRVKFWDALVREAKIKSYHFEDYDQLKKYTCPEESHLSAKEAQYFTKDLLKIMKEDGAMVNPKTN